MTDNNLKNTAATETEIGSGGVGHSMSKGSKGEASVSPAELKMTVELQSQTIAQLKAELDRVKKSGSGDIDKLAEALARIAKPANSGGGATAQDIDNINRSTEFKEFANSVNGRSLMAQQAQLGVYKNEERKPIFIPASYKNVFGPCLAICVNGVHVSIPVDGKTYYINKTHWLHARERMAKVDRYNTTEIVKQVAEYGE